MLFALELCDGYSVSSSKEFLKVLGTQGFYERGTNCCIFFGTVFCFLNLVIIKKIHGVVEVLVLVNLKL